MRHIIAGDLDVTCPLCAAQPGMNCVSTRGARRPFVAVIHQERRNRAIGVRQDLYALREKMREEARDGV